MRRLLPLAALAAALASSGCILFVNSSDDCNKLGCDASHTCNHQTGVCEPNGGSTSGSGSATSTAATSSSTGSAASTGSSGATTTGSGSSGTTSSSSGSGSTGASSGSSSGTTGLVYLAVQPQYGGHLSTVWVCNHGSPLPNLFDSFGGVSTPITTDPAPGGSCGSFGVPQSWPMGRHLLVDAAHTVEGEFNVLAPTPYFTPATPFDLSGLGQITAANLVVEPPYSPFLAFGLHTDGGNQLVLQAPSAGTPAAALGDATLDGPSELVAFAGQGRGTTRSLLVASPPFGTYVVDFTVDGGLLGSQGALSIDPATQAVSVFDLDGDGRQEIIAVDPTSRTVKVGRYDSSVSPPYAFTDTGAACADLQQPQVIDFDLDGYPDLVGVGPLGDGGNAVVITSGAPGASFQGETLVTGDPLVFGRPSAIDLGAGGNHFSIVAPHNGGGFTLFTPDGAGGYTLTTVSTRYPRVISLTVGDVTGDGKPDVVVLERYGSSAANRELLEIFAGTSGGTLNPLPDVIVVSPETLGVHIADLDGDGHADLFVASADTSRGAIIAGRGEPIVHRLRPSFGGAQTGIFAEGVGLGGLSSAQLLLADGGGGGFAPVNLGPVNTSAQAWFTLPGGVPSEFSGPDLFDPAASTPSAGPYRQLDFIDPQVYQPPICGVYNVASTGSAAGALAAGHFMPGPTQQVLVATGGFSIGASVVSLPVCDFGQRFTGGLGLTSFPDGGELWLNEPLAVATADLDRDGLDDLLMVGVGDDGGAGIVTAWSNGDGTFHAKRSELVTNTPCAAAAFGDFNRDGLVDVAVVEPGGNVHFHLQAADGTFPVGPEMLVSGLSVIALTAGDFNGDGYADLAEATVGGGTNTQNAIFWGGPSLVSSTDLLGVPDYGTQSPFVGAAPADPAVFAAGQVWGSGADQVIFNSGDGGIGVFGFLPDAGAVLAYYDTGLVSRLTTFPMPTGSSDDADEVVALGDATGTVRLVRLPFPTPGNPTNSPELVQTIHYDFPTGALIAAPLHAGHDLDVVQLAADAGNNTFVQSQPMFRQADGG